MRVLVLSANTEPINMAVLPMGAGSVAAAAMAAGHEVRMVDLMDEADTRGIARREVRDFAPAVIGISVRNIDDQDMESPRFLLEPVREVVSACRECSGAPIVLGGAGYSIFPESALAYLGADMGIRGEGEQAFTQLLGRMEMGEDLAGIPGLYLPGAGLQGKREFERDLDRFPIPDAGMWSVSTEAAPDLWVPVQTRRGCPMNCNYCSTAGIEGRTIRKRSPEKVVEALAGYREAGFRRFYFVDNTFNLPPSYGRALCRCLIASGLEISWRCILYPGMVEPGLVQDMARAGCREVALGCESGCERILRTMNKRFRPEDVRRASEILAQCGIRRMGFLLLGGPGETRESVGESLAFMDSLNLDAVKITVGVRIYPGTPLARSARGEGILDLDDDLLLPRFYMTPGLAQWLRETLRDWMADRPHWMG